MFVCMYLLISTFLHVFFFLDKTIKYDETTNRMRTNMHVIGMIKL